MGFVFLPSTYWTEGLIALSARWIQPIQQQGRRIPSLISARVLSTCSFLVSGFLTDIVQQIHSLRASGVRSFHFANASGSAVCALRQLRCFVSSYDYFIKSFIEDARTHQKTPRNDPRRFSGEGGIRTREPLGVTRFPSVRAKPDYATSPYSSGRIIHQK